MNTTTVLKSSSQKVTLDQSSAAQQQGAGTEFLGHCGRRDPGLDLLISRSICNGVGPIQGRDSRRQRASSAANIRIFQTAESTCSKSQDMTKD